MAHKKGGGSSRNGRDSNAQRLGVKRFGGQLVNASVEQRSIRVRTADAARTIRSLLSQLEQSSSMRGRTGSTAQSFQ